MATMENDDRVMRLFREALEAAGGAEALTRNRCLGWLPELLEASCIVVLQEEAHQPPEEIARQLDVGMEVVEAILSAPSDDAIARVREPPPMEAAMRSTVAGGVVKFAYAAARA